MLALYLAACHTPEAATIVFKCSWWWAQKASETCRVLLQLLINILPSCITLVLYIQSVHCKWYYRWCCCFGKLSDKLSAYPRTIKPVKINTRDLLEVDTRDELLVNIPDVTACIKERQDALRRTARHVLTRVAKSIDVDGGIFEHLLQTVPTLSLEQ